VSGERKSEADFDAQTHRLPADSGWVLVRLGLTLVRVSMVVLFLASVTFLVAALIAGRDPAYRGPLISLERPVLILATLVALAALLCGLLGISLCWNAPAGRRARYCSRACVVIHLLVMVTAASSVALYELAQISRITLTFVLIFVVYFGSIATLMFWVRFLENVAHFFHDSVVARNAASLWTVAGLSLIGNIMMFIPLTFVILDSGGSEVGGLRMCSMSVIPAVLYFWLLWVVNRVRQSVPTMRRRD
jgi:hypothetical protein